MIGSKTVRLDWLVEVDRSSVDPRTLGDVEVDHYSIPALEATGGPATETAAAIESGKQLLSGGEVLVSKLNPRKARVLRVPTPLQRLALCSGEFIVLRPRSIETRFLEYMLISESTRQRLDAAVNSVTRSHQRVRPEVLTKMWVELPPGTAQRAIADFLDTESARIDALIAKKRRMLAVLDELRAVVISRALWSLPYQPVRLKHLCGLPTSGNRDHSSFTPDDSGVACLRGLNIKPGRIVMANLLRISEEDHRRIAQTQLHPGDLVIVRSGGAGAAASIPEGFGDANCVDLVVVRRSQRLNPRYLEYVVNSREAQEQVKSRSAGALLTHFNAVDAGDLIIPWVELIDQNRIVDVLDDSVTRLDAITQRVIHQINLLQEHRQALITAAVTGELEMPGLVA